MDGVIFLNKLKRSEIKKTNEMIKLILNSFKYFIEIKKYNLLKILI
jgi:hypothetical protein